MEIICKNGTPTTRNPLNVYEQAQIRLEKIFGHFDNIYVSFSGGKDSGVLLQLCTDYIRKHCPGRKIGVFHLDYEIQYGETIRYVDEVLASNSEYFRSISGMCTFQGIDLYFHVSKVLASLG